MQEEAAFLCSVGSSLITLNYMQTGTVQVTNEVYCRQQTETRCKNVQNLLRGKRMNILSAKSIFTPSVIGSGSPDAQKGYRSFAILLFRAHQQ